MADQLKDLIGSLKFNDLTEWVTILEPIQANGTGSEPAFEVKGRFLDSLASRRIGEMSKARGSTSNTDLDSERFHSNFSQRLVVDWRGLTLGNFIRLCPTADIEIARTILEKIGGNEFPYSKQMARLVYDHSDAREFSLAIQEGLKELTRQRYEQTAGQRKEMEGNFDDSSRSGSA